MVAVSETEDNNLNQSPEKEATRDSDLKKNKKTDLQEESLDKNDPADMDSSSIRE
jgi:hypothetical protein